MKSLAFLLALVASGAASGEPSVAYDCQAEKQILLMTDNGEWSYSANDIDRANKDTFRWTFVTSNQADGSMSVAHDPGVLDMIGLGGTYDATVIAPGQFAFATKKDQNCLFTELACGALVEISDIDDRKASFSLVPMGSTKTDDDRREIFQLVMLGTCKKSAVKQ